MQGLEIKIYFESTIFPKFLCLLLIYKLIALSNDGRGIFKIFEFV